jgi:hypothetical protein
VLTEPSAGDPIPPQCRLIEVRVSELRQIFNAIDPSPFSERDLDPRAEQFIIDWAKDLPPNEPWALVVHLERAAGRADEATVLREAIHAYFRGQALASRRRLRELFHRGRISLIIALTFLAASIAVGDAIANYLAGNRLADIIREGFLIGGWVAMWRPLEVFLYDWWPIRAEGRLLQRLSTIPVRLEYAETNSTDAWLSDWPAVAVAEPSRPDGSLGYIPEKATRKVPMKRRDTTHQHTPEEERRIREAALDQTIAESFPASDPPSTVPNPDNHAAIEPSGSPATDRSEPRPG